MKPQSAAQSSSAGHDAHGLADSLGYDAVLARKFCRVTRLRFAHVAVQLTPIGVLSFVRPVVIIGIGNTLRQDDGLGPVAIERLRGRFDENRVELSSVQSLTPELAAAIWKARQVIFIDASEALAPGEIQRRSVECDEQADTSLVHFLSPEALLVWTGRLYGCVPLAEIWLMGVEQVGLSEELTPTIAGKMDELVEVVHASIKLALACE